MAVGPVLLLAAVAAWYAPFEVGARLRVEGKLFAARSWSVERSPQGAMAILRDREAGVTSSLVFQSVERGDVAALVIDPSIRAGRPVTVGDSIAVLGSALFETLLAQYAGNEQVASREAEAISAGEKQALIDEMKVRLERLGQLIRVQERIADRMRQLVERAGESVLELDRVEAELTGLLGEEAVIRAQIDVLESGGRPEDRRVATARLEAARQSLQALARQQEGLVLRSPIDGIVTRPLSDSVLVAIMDTTTWVVALPLPAAERSRVRSGQPALVRVGTAEALATVLDLEPTVTAWPAGDVLLTTIRLDAPLAGALDGMKVEVVLESAPEIFREWAWRHARELFRSEQWLSNRPVR